MNILLPTDGSRHALAAAKALTTWFPRPGARVELLAVVPQARKSMHRRYGRARELSAEWRATAGLWLDETAAPLEAHGQRTSRSIRRGNPAEVVVERAATGSYDLVVVGAKGRGGAPFLDVGSVALAVLEHASAPVLMVRERSPRRRRRPSALHPLRILLATDGGPESDRAIRHFLSLFGAPHAEARVLSVADAAAGGGLDEPDAWRVARGAAAMLAAHGLPADPEVAGGQPAERILGAADSADLVVLGSRAVRRVEERHLGSVALEVARATPCSILIVREGPGVGAAEEEAVEETRAAPIFEIAYRNVEPSEAVEKHVLRGLARLERVASDVVRCHVTLELRHPRHHKGNLYHVGVRLTLPGDELVVSRTPPRHRESETLVAAIGEAFDQARRRLLEARRVERGEIKVHQPQPHGRVTEISSDHGFITTAEGRSLYFHRNSVLGAAWDRLEEGSEVRFAEEAGEEGPQASSVAIVGKHHPVP